MKKLKATAMRRSDAKATEYLFDKEDEARTFVERLQAAIVPAQYFAPVKGWPEHVVMIRRRGVVDDTQGVVRRTEVARAKEAQAREQDMHALRMLMLYGPFAGEYHA